ncbi:MAG TPA: hypothetical protein PLL30_10715 [Candidatus Krumholzibacteria bacterium]|nr:hypothetical protein [Candidatus Krumholzibacteria bacterium]HPD72235.1 hypothetical protein [Candidatus Krumholzibacteria bacterium]HRY40833.1 hypothetical protein [Candidatus Krumholzibacteria bacterium]
MSTSTEIRTPRTSAVVLIVILAFVTGVPFAADACEAEVTFDTLVAGTVFSPATGVMPGDVLFVEDGITVSANQFMFPGGGSAFGGAGIVPAIVAPFVFGNVNICRENNVNLTFDLSGLGIVVTTVTFHWLDLGGFENLRVNGAPLYVGELDLAPAAIAPGVAYSVMEVAVPGGKKGISRLVGHVDRFTVGGQEFAIDEICVDGIVPGSGRRVHVSLDDPAKGLVVVEQESWTTVKSLFR